MLTIEHCENLHLQLTPETQKALATAIAGGVSLRPDVSRPFTLRQPIPALGEIWPDQGGRYAGTMPARGDKPGWHLILASDAKSAVKWGPYNHDVEGAKDTHDGAANTRALVADAKEHHLAAQWANAYAGDGFDDWYLPAQAELMLMWICVPQLFEKGYHWSSTQYSPDGAWVQYFEDGGSSVRYKNGEFRAVAVRRLAL